MDFKVVGYPKATVVTDDIFRYLVVEYPDGEGTVDVFRTLQGGCYEVHKQFGSHRAFREAMPNVSRVVQRCVKKGTIKNIDKSEPMVDF